MTSFHHSLTFPPLLPYPPPQSPPHLLSLHYTPTSYNSGNVAAQFAQRNVQNTQMLHACRAANASDGYSWIISSFSINSLPPPTRTFTPPPRQPQLPCSPSSHTYRHRHTFTHLRKHVACTCFGRWVLLQRIPETLGFRHRHWQPATTTETRTTTTTKKTAVPGSKQKTLMEKGREA